MFDGTTTLMPDTAGNRKTYPPTWNQKADVGLPSARVAAVFSLSCGVILDLATAGFQGALQTQEAFRPVISTIGRHNTSTRELLYQQLLQAIAVHRVADRPNRFEPRRIKRRHKHYVPLAVPRHEAKRRVLKGLTKNQATFVASTGAAPD